MRNSANDDYVEVITQPDPDNIRLIQSRRVYALDPQPDPRIQNLKFKGYLVVSQNLRFLQGLVADLSRNLDGKLYVVDADGCIVAAHDEALLGQKVSAELRQKIERLMAGQPMPDGLAATILPNLYVVGDLPPSWLAVSASRLAESLFQTTGAAILLTSLLLSLLLRKIVVAPIKSLIAVTEEIGAERSMVDLKTARADEIGMLTQALDGMQTTLHERRQALLEQNQTLDHLLIINANPKDRHAVVHHPHDQGTHNHANDFPHAARHRGAANKDRRDHIQLKPCPRFGGG
jgi:methyl-accepting chemotaxis protein